MNNNQNELKLSSGKPIPFGTSLTLEGINFSVYVKSAKAVSLCIFDETNLMSPSQEIHLDPSINRTGNVWHICVQGLRENPIYAYRLIPTTGLNIQYLLLDPYAKLVESTRKKWGREQNETDPAYLPLGQVITDDAFDWEGDRPPRIPRQDLIIYEMHVRGFTNDPSSNVKNPGTYLGMIEKIPYLKELGINAVELMPIFEFNENEVVRNNPETNELLYNYWGYSQTNFFSPMRRYASQTDGINPVKEFKMLVKELHKNGIEVILDVVYNHTNEGDHKGPIYSFKGFDSHAYYMIDHQGNYMDFSGCGNTVNANYPITRELILDSLRYWVSEMHVDGFRFDLASILTRAPSGAPLSHPPLIDAITKDPILADTKLIAEAWDVGGLYQVGEFVPGSKRWAEWNGRYRDVTRRFIKGTPKVKTAFTTALCGSQDLYGKGRSPLCSINFITSHDGFTLADLVSYNEKHNIENGEDNRDGLNENDSWNCGVEGDTNNQKILALRSRQVRNFHLALMFSQGVPLLYMGDEYAHSRDGNNNAWCQDNALNWFQWGLLEERQGFHRYYRSLIHFRHSCPLLKRVNFLTDQDISWHGNMPFQPHWEVDNKLIAFTLNGKDETVELYVAFNAGETPQTVSIPPLPYGKKWVWMVNTANPSPDDYYDEENRPPLATNTFRLISYSAIVLVVV